MVYGFVVHTLGPGPGGTPGVSTVLYSQVFGCDLSDEKLDTGRSQRKEQIAIVARQTQTMCLLRRQLAGRSVSDYVIHSTEDPISLHEEDVGAFTLSAGDPFPQELTVLWVAVFSLGFSLICDLHDSLTLAEITLRLLVKYLVDSLKLLTQSSNILLRADKIQMSIDKFMPHGQLLFLNHQAAQALEKELSGSMTL
ncbi:AP-5 complex subunit sigma-1 [Pelodytes ibericus]